MKCPQNFMPSQLFVLLRDVVFNMHLLSRVVFDIISSALPYYFQSLFGNWIVASLSLYYLLWEETMRLDYPYGFILSLSTFLLFSLVPLNCTLSDAVYRFMSTINMIKEVAFSQIGENHVGLWLFNYHLHSKTLISEFSRMLSFAFE